MTSDKIITVDATPTKNFFIRMLTRDIELNDAILDLLDNCLDGVMRSKDGPPQEDDFEFYKGYRAEIEITPTSFSILDNCGGIPYEVAIEKAFRMGNPGKQADEKELPTVGIYGIGMKRAIFKMGLEAYVCSKTIEHEFCVYISEDWMTSEDGKWEFPIEEDKTGLAEYGTKVVVEKLNSDVAALWKKADDLAFFENRLRELIAYHYSFIIEKGFLIKVNGKQVEPNIVKLLFDDTDGQENQKKLMPYLYQKIIDGVDVKIAVGFYEPMITEDEMDEENEGHRTSRDAGWTVICNDRVVLYNNKDHLTGWGEANVPRYHTQFIGIRGVVLFRSVDPIKLPMTTTKRGIDMSSALYSEVREKMREGLKIFTDHTNRWKGRTNEERNIAKQAPRVEMNLLLQPHDKIQEQFAALKFNSRNGAHYFKPSLPVPPNEGVKILFVRYQKPASEIDEVCKYMYGEVREDLRPGQIGERCFDIILEKARGTHNE